MKTFFAYFLTICFLALTFVLSYFLFYQTESEPLNNLITFASIMTGIIILFSSFVYPPFIYFILYSSNKHMRDFINNKSLIKSQIDLELSVKQELVKSYKIIYENCKSFLDHLVSIFANLSPICLTISFASCGYFVMPIAISMIMMWRWFFMYVNDSVFKENKKTYYKFKDTYDSLVEELKNN